MPKPTKTDGAPTVSDLRRRERSQMLGAVSAVLGAGTGALLILVGRSGPWAWGSMSVAGLGLAWYLAHLIRWSKPSS